MTSPDEPLRPLHEVIKSVTEWLKSLDDPFVIIGGVAVALLGTPRSTGDVDAMTLAADRDFKEIVAAAKQFGLAPRISDAADFAMKSRVLLLRHKSSGYDVDVSIGGLPFEREMCDRAVCRNVAGVLVPLPTPEDLVIMKAVAGRDKDLIDIRGVLEKCDSLDVARIRKWVFAFGEVLDAPEMTSRIEGLLQSVNPKRRSTKKRATRPKRRRGND